MRFVIVEDDPNLNEYMTRLLTSEGHEVFSTLDGSDALALITEVLPDVVFLDIILPNIDGRDICRDIRSTPKTLNIHVIVISGRDSELDKDLYFELGADDFVAKPVLKHDILRLIERTKRTLKNSNK